MPMIKSWKFTKQQKSKYQKRVNSRNGRLRVSCITSLIMEIRTSSLFANLTKNLKADPKKTTSFYCRLLSQDQLINIYFFYYYSRSRCSTWSFCYLVVVYLPCKICFHSQVYNQMSCHLIRTCTYFIGI